MSLASPAGGDASPFGSLLAPTPSRPAASAPILPAQEVRKFVTLVFTDLKDSTALTASIDAEAMNEIKARYFSSMAVEIERHGGKVEKNIGDAIMAVFGRVRAREDDALRGVRAAAGMVSERCAGSTRSSREVLRRPAHEPDRRQHRRGRRQHRPSTPTRTSRPATRSTSPPGSSRTPRPTRS